MTELETKLNQIWDEKSTKIIPTNIKKNVNVLGITGSYEGEPPTLQSKTVTITQNGTQTITADSGYDGLSQVGITANITSEPIISKDIDFVDYDGTLLYTYTMQEIQNMQELPALPTHTGLICQEWNFTLAELKNMPKGTQVGATYITDDDNTRLYIELISATYLNVSVCFQQTKNYGIELDWGDGSEVETFNGSYSRITATHTYAAIGNYVISFKSLNNTQLVLGNNNSAYNVFGMISGLDLATSSILKKVELGKYMRMTSQYMFQKCSKLETITIPKEVNVFTSAMFYHCHSLKYVVVPNTLQTMPSMCFSYCYSLKKITLPNSVTILQNNLFEYNYSIEEVIYNKTLITTFQGNIFNNCYCLKNVIIPTNANVTSVRQNFIGNCDSINYIFIPSNITSIENGAFSNIHGIIIYDFSTHETIPTIGSFYADIKTKIVVPDALYEDWKTSWSTYASYIIKASEA